LINETENRDLVPGMAVSSAFLKSLANWFAQETDLLPQLAFDLIQSIVL